MFSGITETIGKIVKLERANGCLLLTILPNIPFTDVIVGDSISVNGVCLTVTGIANNHFDFTAVPETLRLTNLNNLVKNDLVNLERSMQLHQRIGGHIIQGHIDGMGKILSLDQEGAALIAKISLPNHIAKYVVKKGYIALDGMSITVIEANTEWFTVTFIPHTQLVTTVHHYQPGTSINIEVDMMAKYVEKLLGAYNHANIH